jgi:hypothetical protein
MAWHARDDEDVRRMTNLKCRNNGSMGTTHLLDLLFVFQLRSKLYEYMFSFDLVCRAIEVEIRSSFLHHRIPFMFQ